MTAERWAITSSEMFLLRFSTTRKREKYAQEKNFPKNLKELKSILMSVWETYTLDVQIFVKNQKQERKGHKIERSDQLAYFILSRNVTSTTSTEETRTSTTDSQESVDRQRLELSKSSKNICSQFGT